MIPFLPPDSQYDFQQLDTPILTIKTDDNDLFEWTQYRFDTLSPTPIYYGPFHDAMVNIDQDLDLAYEEFNEPICDVVLQDINEAEKEASPDLPDNVVKIEGEIIHLEPMIPHRILRKRNEIPNYNEDQRSRQSVAINPIVNESTSKNINKRDKRKVLTIKTDALPLSSTSTCCSPSPSSGYKFTACLPCRGRKIKCVPNHTGSNQGSCLTCIRRKKKCVWEKMKLRRSISSSPASSQISTSTSTIKVKVKRRSSIRSITPMTISTRRSTFASSRTLQEEEKDEKDVEMNIKCDSNQCKEVGQLQEQEDKEEDGITAKVSLATIKNEESLDTLVDHDDSQKSKDDEMLLQTPLHCSSRAFGRSLSICAPSILSPSITSLSNSPSPISTSPSTPQTQCHDDTFISIIHPNSNSQSEQDCLLFDAETYLFSS